MKIWIELNDNRLTGYSTSQMESFIMLEVDEEPIDFVNWKYEHGQLVYDPDGYVPPTIEDPLTTQERLEDIEMKQSQTDEAVLELADMMLGDSLKGGA